MKTLHDIPLNPTDLIAIQETVVLLKSRFPVVAVKLFGSKAIGKSDSESDIDLLVLTSKNLSWQERNAMTDAIYEIQLKYAVAISLLVISEGEWSSGLVTALPIHDNIEREGVSA